MTPTGRPRAMDRLRKQRAFQLASEGRTRKDIASCLGVSERTLRREVARDAPFAEVLREVETRARHARRRPGRISFMPGLRSSLLRPLDADKEETLSKLSAIPSSLEELLRR